MAGGPAWAYRQDLVQEAIRQYGRPETYFEDLHWRAPEDLTRLREQRLSRELWRAWDIPFYRRKWESAGFHPSRFRGLEDLSRIPMYTVDDIRESIELNPPYGDYQGVVPGPGVDGTRMYFSGGTTGKPRPTVYTAWDRIVGSLMVARGLQMHGFRHGDIVLNAWSYGTHNAAWAWDEALWLWLGCTPITVGTGNVTSSIKQLELARDYRAKSILTTADYLLHLRRVAEESGLTPDDFAFECFQTIGDVEAVSEAWGVEAYEIYAFHEVQTAASECRTRGGLHVFQDAFVVEIVDTETGEPLTEGEQGDIVITCLYKSGSPQIRYNIKDLSSVSSGICSCGASSQRLAHLAGRSDTMVKLRGVNVWPEAIGATIEDVIGGPAEFFCIAYRDENRNTDEMMVLVEGLAAAGLTTKDLAARLAAQHSVRLKLVEVPADSLASLTGRGTAAKLRRFKDQRNARSWDEDLARLLAQLGMEPNDKN